MAGLGIYDYGARFYSPKLGRFLSADTIVPGVANPQALNRYSYVLGNPIRYNDPTGHMCSDPDDIWSPGCDGSGTPPPTTPLPNPGGGDDDEDNGNNNDDVDLAEELALNNDGLPVTATPTTSNITYDPLLGNRYTPVASAAVQVLSATLMDFAFLFVETPIGLALTVGAFVVNRAASLVGLASTFYQYENDLYGTNFTDVSVSGGSFLLGWIPQLSEPLGIAVLIYSAYRLEYDAPINIPAPDFLK